jgi:hypothetical protein
MHRLEVNLGVKEEDKAGSLVRRFPWDLGEIPERCRYAIVGRAVKDHGRCRARDL